MAQKVILRLDEAHGFGEISQAEYNSHYERS
jgi:hypothetical protein